VSPIGVLASNDLRTLYFRAVCALGFTIDRHLSALTDACTASMHDAAAWGPLYEIERITRCLENADDLESEDFAYYLNHIRGHLLNSRAPDCEGFNPELASVIRRIAEDLSPLTPEDLAAAFEHTNEAVHGRVGDAISGWGGPRAMHRWQSCTVAAIQFDFAGGGPTACSFLQNRITFHIGERKDPARSFFILDFFLFHEYVSHAFPLWNDTLLTEGLLVETALTLMPYVADHPVRHRFVRAAWNMRPGGPTTRHNVEVEAWAEWLIRWGGIGFLRYILDWAATPADDRNLARLKRIGFLYNRGPNQRIREAFAGPYRPVEILHDELQLIARELLPH